MDKDTRNYILESALTEMNKKYRFDEAYGLWPVSSVIRTKKEADILGKIWAFDGPDKLEFFLKLVVDQYKFWRRYNDTK